VLAAAIREVRGGPLERMGNDAPKALEERFDRAIATGAYRQLLERLAAGVSASL
jgi:hypothetical protein